MNFSLVFDAAAGLAETPVWDGRKGLLYWTDFTAGAIHGFNPQTGKNISFSPHGGMIGSAVLTDEPDVLLCALDAGICLFNTKTTELELLYDINKNTPQNRCNELRVDAEGRIVVSTFSKQFGSPDYTADQFGSFFMIDTDGSLCTIVPKINQYNGIVWTKNGQTMYVVDSYNSLLVAFDYDPASGPVSGPKKVLDFSEIGMPDGMAIDSLDNLYVCHWSGKISLWDQDLNLADIYTLPVPEICCCGFGGDDLKYLYVTTGSFGYTAEQLQNRNGAGGIFCARVDIPGAKPGFYKTAGTKKLHTKL